MYNAPNDNYHPFISIVFLAISITLTACGGGGDDDDNGDPNSGTQPPVQITRVLSGTAAVGAPVEGTVTVVTAKGETLVTQSGANGAYSINLAGNTGPYLIRIEPNDGSLPTLYSYATSSGIANISPFTTLALFLSYRTDLANAFSSWTSTLSTWSRKDIEQALAKINANFETGLRNAGVEPTTYDFFTAQFDANQTGIDAFFDNYNVSVDYGNNTFDITDTSGTAVAFDENVDTTNYYIGAWFIPAGSAAWEVTLTTVENGGTPKSSTFVYPSNDIPWNEERFNEIFWNNLPPTNTVINTCEDNPDVSCNIKFEVSKLTSSYNVTGNGEVGTLIEADAGYSWRISGWVQSGGFRQNIDQSQSWSYSWKWERIS